MRRTAGRSLRAMQFAIGGYIVGVLGLLFWCFARSASDSFSVVVTSVFWVGTLWVLRAPIGYWLVAVAAFGFAQGLLRPAHGWPPLFIVLLAAACGFGVLPLFVHSALRFGRSCEERQQFLPLKDSSGKDEAKVDHD